MAQPQIDDVEAFNDRLAREHDIDDYYDRSSLPIRLIEQRRLKHIVDLVDARPGDRILEVGCGGGHVLRQFPKAKLTGIDVSGVMLEKAERNLRGYDVTLKKGELDELGIEDDSFDAIVCTEVLEHIVDPDKVLRGIARVARPGARVVITFPNDTLINQLKGVILGSPLKMLPPFQRLEWGGDHFHLHVWTIAEMRTLLARYFVVVDERFAPTSVMPIRACFGCRAR
ncbi:MAG: class I SAM-dependent methyltransferase [Polyangiaceae bacterium]